MVWVKSTSHATDWMVGSDELGVGNAWDKYIYLNDTASVADHPMWNDTYPSTTTVSLGTHNYVNENDRTYIMYLFSDVAGYSKIGSYTGNGDANGPFVYTGFKPSLILAKRLDANAGWILFDNKRLGYNGGNYWVDPQNFDAEITDATGMFDQLSNGFKIRSTFGSRNTSGGTYMYMAIGQSLVSSNGVTAKAR